MSPISPSASEVREQVLLNHLPQVRILAAKLHRRCPPQVLLEDLVSVGTVGLLDAYHRFDAGRNLKFKTLAKHRIRGATLDYLRQLDPLPRAVRRFQKRREIAMAKLRQQIADEATEDQIAGELGLAMEPYRKLAAVGQCVVLSLESSCSRVRFSNIPDSGDPRNRAILSSTIKRAIDALPEPEYRVILAALAGESNHAIAKRLGVTEGRVSQIRHSAFGHLRTALGIKCRLEPRVRRSTA